MSGQRSIASPMRARWRRSSPRRRRASRPAANCRPTSSMRCMRRGLFRMLVPRSLGGEEVSPVAFMQAIEEIAKADASTAWCIAQTSVCSTICQVAEAGNRRGDFQEKSARRAGLGPAPTTPRRLRKRAAFASPASGRSPAAAGMPPGLPRIVRVYEPDGEPRRDADGNPVQKTFVVPRERATIKDVWHVIGLKGTGSDTYALTDVFVPEDRAIGYHALDPAERREHGPLYAFTIYQLFGSSFPAIALGIARATLDAFVELAQTKKPTGQHVAAARQRRDPVAGRRRAGAARRRAGVFLCDLGGDLAGGADRERCRSTSGCGCAWRRSMPASRRGRSSRPPTLPPAPWRFSKAIRSSAGSATCTRCRSRRSRNSSIFEAIGRHFLGLPPNSRLI